MYAIIATGGKQYKVSEGDKVRVEKLEGEVGSVVLKDRKIMSKDGILVTNADDPDCLDLRKSTSAKVVTFGLRNDKANFIGRNISYDVNGFPKFDV